MEQDERKASERRLRSSNEEMLPLSVAAHVAYFHFTEPSKQLVDSRPLAEVVKLVAVALSQLAPIYRAEASEPLGAAEIKKLFFSRDGEPLDLDVLRIKRGDFRHALLTDCFGPKRDR